MDNVQFEIVTTCAGVEFAYRAGDTVTLGIDITDETARDLMRAGFIKKVESVERATVAAPETTAKKMKPQPAKS